jgi:hypothetical protein
LGGKEYGGEGRQTPSGGEQLRRRGAPGNARVLQQRGRTAGERPRRCPRSRLPGDVRNGTDTPGLEAGQLADALPRSVSNARFWGLATDAGVNRLGTAARYPLSSSASAGGYIGVFRQFLARAPGPVVLFETLADLGAAALAGPPAASRLDFEVSVLPPVASVPWSLPTPRDLPKASTPPRPNSSVAFRASYGFFAC